MPTASECVDWTAAIKNVITTLVLVGVGGWLACQSENLSIAISQHELARQDSAGPAFSLSSGSELVLNGDCLLTIHLTAANNTSRTWRLSMRDAVLRIGLMNTDERSGRVAVTPATAASIPSFTPSGRQVRSLQTALLRPGVKRTYVAAAPVESGNLYFVQLAIPREDRENWYWSAADLAHACPEPST